MNTTAIARWPDRRFSRWPPICTDYSMANRVALKEGMRLLAETGRDYR